MADFLIQREFLLAETWNGLQLIKDVKRLGNQEKQKKCIKNEGQRKRNNKALTSKGASSGIDCLIVFLTRA